MLNRRKRREKQRKKETRIHKNAGRMKSVTEKELLTHEDRIFERKIRKGAVNSEKLEKWLELD